MIILFIVPVVVSLHCYLLVTGPLISFVAWHFIVFIELMYCLIYSVVLTKAFFNCFKSFCTCAGFKMLWTCSLSY